MPETGVSCDVAAEEAEQLLAQVSHRLEEHTSYEQDAIAHILEHLISRLAERVGELREEGPRDVLLQVAMSLPSFGELLELLARLGADDEELDDDDEGEEDE